MAFSTPLICCSSGVMTVSAMVLGEAPGYCPLTTTVGGTISGYSLIGSTGMASKPATVINIASTVANIGRSIKNEEIFIGAQPLVRCWRPGGAPIHAHRDFLRGYCDARMHALRTIYHNHVPGLQALA